MPHVSVQRKMARGAVWMLLLNFTERSLGIISIALLARLLTPADFGISAMAGSFIYMAQMFTAFGFDVALIQNQSALESDYHTAWTFNVILGMIILLLMLGLAAPIASFYNQPEIFWVVCALASGPLIIGFENIGVVAFRKDLDFRKEFRFQISRKLIGFLVTMSVAFWLRNYWALVAGMLASRISGTLTSYFVHPFRPRFSLVGTRRIFGVSKWLLISNIFGYLRDRSPDFFIGRLSGPAALGIYNVTDEFSHLPTTEIGAPVNRALLPGFAKLVDPVAFQSAYSNAIKLLALGAIPAACGILAVAPYAVPVVFGPKWIEGVPLMEILSISGAFTVFRASMSSVLIAKGFVAPITTINMIVVIIFIGAMVVVVPRFGLLGTAYLTLAVSVLATPLFLAQLRHRLHVPMSIFVSAVSRPIIASLVMIFAVRFFIPGYTVAMPFSQAAAWLVTGVVLGVATYVTVILFLWASVGRPQGAERLILEKVRIRVQTLIEKRRKKPDY